MQMIDRPRNQATTYPPARRGRNNARRIAVSAKWRIVVAVILDRWVFFSDNPGWRHAAAPLGLPWALMFNTFGVMILEKAQHQKAPAKENLGLPSLALHASMTDGPVCDAIKFRGCSSAKAVKPRAQARGDVVTIKSVLEAYRRDR